MAARRPNDLGSRKDILCIFAEYTIMNMMTTVKHFLVSLTLSAIVTQAGEWRRYTRIHSLSCLMLLANNCTAVFKMLGYTRNRQNSPLQKIPGSYFIILSVILQRRFRFPQRRVHISIYRHAYTGTQFRM